MALRTTAVDTIGQSKPRINQPTPEREVMYTPNNLAIYVAAFAGALAGMGSSGRQVQDTISADYSSISGAAGAFAQAFDTAWGTNPATTLDVASVEGCCEGAFEDRSPPVGAPFDAPSNYTGLALALVALVQAGDTYVAGQGITPPPASGGSSAALQLVWYVNDVTGLDTNNGSTPALARKTVASVSSSLSSAQAGVNYLIQVLADVPPTDSFRPSFLALQNQENINPVTGVRQVFNFTLQGTLTPLGASSLVGGFTATGANQAVITLATAAVVTAGVDQLFQITASPDAGNIGATFGIGKDLGAGVARIIDLSPAPGKTLNLGAIIGSTVTAVTATKWNTDLIQVEASQGRVQVNYLWFPAVAAAPADQQQINQRNISITFFGCKFERNCAFSFGSASTISGCVCIGNATFTQLTSLAGGFSHVNTLFKNLDVKCVSGVTFWQVNGVYLENATYQTKTTTTILDYGASLAAGASKGPRAIMITGAGLSIYNWPLTTDSAGFLLADGASARTSALIRGGYDGVTPAGAVGILVDGSELEYAPGAPASTIAGDNGGTGADLRIANPLGTVDLACRALQGGVMAIAAAGAVTIDAQLLKNWANFNGAGATQFQKYAFNPHTGGKVWQATA